MEEGLKLNQESIGEDGIAAASGLDEDSVVVGSNPSAPTNLFPADTPGFIARRMVALADLAGHHVLEPSAGFGNLAEAIRAGGAASVLCIELNERAAMALFQKGFSVAHKDFLRFSPTRYFSRIVMNPPRNAFAHIGHAISLLAEGGVLVTLHRMDCDQVDRLDVLPGDFYPLPEETFVQDGKPVLARIIVIKK